MQYGREFGIEPHLVDPPILWWNRWLTDRNMRAMAQDKNNLGYWDDDDEEDEETG